MNEESQLIEWLSEQPLPLAGDGVSLPKLEAAMRAAWNAGSGVGWERGWADLARWIETGQQVPGPTNPFLTPKGADSE